ncbi:MAG: TlpA family protein disulfide reductase [Myxococcota bacterium]
MRSLLLYVCLAAGLALAGGKPAPDFQLRDVNNVQRSLAEHKGKVVLVNFWATWCQPCMVEMPHLEAMYKELGPRGFVVIGISADAARDASKVKPLVVQKGLTYPVLLDPQTTVVSVYNPAKTMPFNVLVDRAGTIVSQHAGYNPGDEVKLKEEVLKLLGSP